MTESQPQPGGGEAARAPVLTDEEIALESKRVALDVDRAELEQLRDQLETARRNRRLRARVANGALVLMLAQIVVANGIFVWYGDTNGWDVSPTAIGAWLGATVAQVVSVVLVIMNYLFPNPPARA